MFFCTSRTYFQAYSFTNFVSFRSFSQRTIHRRLTFFKFLAFLDEDEVSFVSFFFLSSMFTSICNPLGYDRL